MCIGLRWALALHGHCPICVLALDGHWLYMDIGLICALALDGQWLYMGIEHTKMTGLNGVFHSLKTEFNLDIKHDYITRSKTGL